MQQGGVVSLVVMGCVCAGLSSPSAEACDIAVPGDLVPATIGSEQRSARAGGAWWFTRPLGLSDGDTISFVRADGAVVTLPWAERLWASEALVAFAVPLDATAGDYASDRLGVLTVLPDDDDIVDDAGAPTPIELPEPQLDLDPFEERLSPSCGVGFPTILTDPNTIVRIIDTAFGERLRVNATITFNVDDEDAARTVVWLEAAPLDALPRLDDRGELTIRPTGHHLLTVQYLDSETGALGPEVVVDVDNPAPYDETVCLECGWSWGCQATAPGDGGTLSLIGIIGLVWRRRRRRL